jgi:glycosyltransferase involved in cell wall biosynthesis
MVYPSKIRILFFIGSLQSSGKERRLIELMTYLKSLNKYELLLVLAYDIIEYPVFSKLNITYRILNKKPNSKNPLIYFKMNDICREFRPHIIHAWGNMPTFYMLPIGKLHKIPIVNSQITNARPNRERISFSSLTSRLNFRYSTVVISNSYAGLSSHNLKENGKYRVIYNGINMERFKNITSVDILRHHFGLRTKHAVVMVAAFSDNKDYDKYLEICKYVELIRYDITFFAVGDGNNFKRIKEKALISGLNNIQFTGKINNVEDLVSICDLGILLSPNGEGISNSILEYMALGKPVIANDAGGTREIIDHGENGYLIENENAEEIAALINSLLDNSEIRRKMGAAGRRKIEESFILDKMGLAFESVYHDVLNGNLS